MSQRNKLPGNIRLEDIRVNIPNCPGCGKEHDIVPKRPYTTHNCGRGKGTYHINVSSLPNQLEVTVTFQSVDYEMKEVTDLCNITFV